MATSTKANRTARPPDEDVAATYNEFKEFEGRKYTGMKIGRSHKWYYDPGEWKETKITPDEWKIEFHVTKRRAGHAPEGSGVPVGTGYHWYILAHQNVTKVNANDYTTSMTGMKFKLAHKRADKQTWSASTQAQRRNMVKILRQVIEDLEREGEAETKAPAAAAKPSRKTVRSRSNGRAATQRTLPLKGHKTKKKTRNGRHSRAA
jgi:hypothetical protein